MMRVLVLLVLVINCLTVSASKKAPVQDGEYLEYSKNGSLKEKSNYKNGLLDGECLQYHKDGKIIKRITIYKEGKKTGLEKYYDKSGILKDFKSR